MKEPTKRDRINAQSHFLTKWKGTPLINGWSFKMGYKQAIEDLKQLNNK